MADHSKAIGVTLVVIGKALTQLGHAMQGESEVMTVSAEQLAEIKASKSVVVAPEVAAPVVNPPQAPVATAPAQPPASVDAPKALKIQDLESASRDQLKTWAESYGLTAAGKKASELRTMLAEALKVGGASDGPSVDDMKGDLEVFIWLNREVLEESGFFSDTPSGDPDNPTYNEIMASEKLIREAWKDNIKPVIDSNEWDEMKSRAQASMPAATA